MKAEIVTIKKDQLLFEQDDFPDCMYIVKSGQIQLFVTNGQIEKNLIVVTTGHLIGEMALFDNKFRSASARALTDASLVKLPYAQLQKDLERMPEWVQVTLKTLAEKIRLANEKMLTEGD